MELLSGQKVFNKFLTDKLHEDTQVEDCSVSLTAGAIYKFESAGDLDFGGSEFRLADRSEVEPMKRNEDDDYGWWNLDEGRFLLELNESIDLKQGHRAVLYPHDHLNWNGANHPTLWLSEDESHMKLTLALSVASQGINIKENARVTSLRVFRENS